MNNFHPLEVVDRGSETQLQVGENLNYLKNNLTLPLPISHLCENYLPLPIAHLCEIHMCTSIDCNGEISLHAWLNIANQNGQ